MSSRRYCILLLFLIALALVSIYPVSRKNANDTSPKNLPNKVEKADRPSKPTEDRDTPTTFDKPPEPSPPGLGGFPEGSDWPPARAVTSTYEVPHFDKRRKLDIVTNRIAVLATGLKSGSTDHTIPAQAALAREGFSPGDLQVHPIAGWTFANTGTVLGSNDGPDAVQRIVDLVNTLGKVDSGLDFSSPVFVDPDQGGLLIVTPTILLGFQKDTTVEDRARTLEIVPDVADSILEMEIDLSRAYVKVPLPTARNGFEVLNWANALSGKGAVLFAEPDMIFEGMGSLVPNDPEFLNCWGLENTGQSGGQVDFDMGATDAWDITTGSASVKVLIIDTGVQQDHPDINQLPGRDFTSESGSNPNGDPVNSFDRHGTPVAGAVSAIINNGIGVVGIAPGVKSISARCFISTSSSGSWTATYSWTADALDWAETQGVVVSNNSNLYGGTSAAIEASYTSTRDNGMVHFACAGNDGISSMGYPARVSDVNGVAASDRDGNRASFSQYGSGLAFTAPGESIRLPDQTGSDGYSSGDYAWVNGTSFASPYTAGVAALLLSLEPTLTAAEVEVALQQSCVDMGPAGYDTGYGWGHVNAAAALEPFVVSDDNYETNNTYNSSYDLTNWEGQWLATDSGEGIQLDEDYYSIDVTPGDNRVTVDCLFSPGGSNIVVTLYDASFDLLATATATSGRRFLDFVVPSSGIHYILVDGDDSGTSYNLWWNDVRPPYLEIDDATESIPHGGGTHSFQVDTNVTWTWSKEPTAPWLTRTNSESDTFVYTVPANLSVQPRSTVITLTDGNLSVTHTVEQAGAPPTLSLTDSSQNFPDEGGDHTFNTSSNTTWTWSVPPSVDWIDSSEAVNQSGNQAFSYTVTENRTASRRTALITYTNGTQTRMHTVTQDGAPPDDPGAPIVSTGGGGAIQLSWEATFLAADYEIWRGKSSDTFYMEKIGETTSNAFSDTGAQTGAEYYYRIVATNANGSSEYSASAKGGLFGKADAMVQDPKGIVRGGNIYGSLAPQTAVFKTKRKSTAKFTLFIQNDSQTGSEILRSIASPGSKSFKVGYISASRGNITAALIAGTYVASLSAGAMDSIGVSVKPKGKAKKKKGKISLTAVTNFVDFPASSDGAGILVNKKKSK